MKYTITSVFIFLLSTSTHSEEIKLSEKSIEGFTYHVIEKCPFLRGLGQIIYSYGRRGDKLELSDFCFDQESGVFHSSEQLKNLQLAVDGPDGQVFEDLSQGSSQSDRPAIAIYAMSDMNDFCTEHVSYPTFIEIRKNSQDRNTDANYVTGLEGYFFKELSQPKQGKAYDRTLMLVSILGIEGGRGSNKSGLEGDAFSGELVFNGSSGKMQLGPGRDHVTKNQSGELTVEVSKSGQVTGKGTARFENSRLVGHAPNEWIEASIDFVGLRGHVVGPNGENIKLRGWGKGTYTDASGNALSFEASAVFEACASNQ